ncbi:MAG TPA: 7-cyano-7-deazaguanine synthase QueC [Anaerolineae bacterium]|jgi:7-cyano-7-deazaguanine synthase|nr:7-cyano-7-deazaguanine synthase QueC [Anaerolineae bacterium]
MKSVVLLSGGIDSTVCTVIAGQTSGFDQVAGLNVLYGQRHSKESGAAEAIAGHLGLGMFKKIILPNELFKGAGSSLIDPTSDIPHGPYPDNVGPVSTYVPFRNGNLISIATAYALKLGAETIYFGAHAEDALNWAYPDCTPEFLGAMKNAVWVGTYHKVRLITPLEWLTKVDIIALGKKLGVPFELTWSCYQGDARACGQCATCLSRLAAFKANGLDDPVPYRSDAEGSNV